MLNVYCAYITLDLSDHLDKCCKLEGDGENDGENQGEKNNLLIPGFTDYCTDVMGTGTGA